LTAPCKRPVDRTPEPRPTLDAMATRQWSIEELQQELVRFEQAARAAGLEENSVHTYVDRPARFVRWLAGDFKFQGGR
jgi:hypothetical protein